jgi:small subunit ribosomal protein S13
MAEFRHLVRIANTDIKGEKSILYALKKIKGVSIMFANMACMNAGIERTKKAGELTDAEIKSLETEILHPSSAPNWILNRRLDPETGENKHLIGSDLIFVKDNDLKEMKKLKSYKGIRHMYKLPVRGQRTKSNFRRNKGKAIAGLKKKGVTRK